jgi:hypothetical protein
MITDTFDRLIVSQQYNDQQHQFIPTQVPSLDSEPRPSGLTWNEVTDRLLDIRNLPDDWDGQGAVAPETDLVRKCFKFVQHLRNQLRTTSGAFLPPPTFVSATPEGTVSFEWQYSSGVIEAEATATAIEWAFFPEGGSPEFVDWAW